MKYIRTKDGHIFESEFVHLKLYDDGKCLMEYKDKFYEPPLELKQADTVEELFDEYVVYAEDYGYFNPTEIIHRRWVFDHIEEAKEQIKLIGAGIKRIIYGAIWTDKGLIYVAKMNEKGELELL